jgi:hypothetical protein
MNPGWISAIIAVVGVVAAISGSWAVAQHKIKHLEREQKSIKDAQSAFTAAVDSLKDTIRDEFDRAIDRINKLLFEEGGMTRYVPRKEWEKAMENCRAEICRRIKVLE